jgi:hypothetical protein
MPPFALRLRVSLVILVPKGILPPIIPMIHIVLIIGVTYIQDSLVMSLY